MFPVPAVLEPVAPPPDPPFKPLTFGLDPPPPPPVDVIVLKVYPHPEVPAPGVGVPAPPPPIATG